MTVSKDDWVREPDQVQLFTLYTMFGGNVERVAVVTRTPVKQIEELAHDYNWKAKAGGRGRLDTDEGVETERVMNRVSTYANAVRLERVFNNLIKDLDSDEKFARAFCTVMDGKGDTSFSVKNIVDLAKGTQILGDIKYRALGDKLAQDADTSTAEAGVAAVSLAVYKALGNRFNVDAVDATKQILKAVKQDATDPNTES